MYNAKTTERSQALIADVAARYEFARKYCKGKSVLDIGTGLGFGARFIKESGAREVLGIDYSKESIKLAKYLELEGLSFRLWDALKVSSLKQKFDIVLAFEILEHLPQNKGQHFINSIFDILKKDGILLLTTPNGLKTEYFLGRPYNVYHAKEYDGYEIRSLLSKRFSSIIVCGYRCVNEDYLKRQNTLTSSNLYRLFHILGGFRWFREFVAFIPTSVKKRVTKEDSLPSIGSKDYTIEKRWEDCDLLFVIGKKSN